MRSYGFMTIICVWFLLGCQLALPSANNTQATAYPAAEKPSDVPAYPAPTDATPTTDTGIVSDLPTPELVPEPTPMVVPISPLSDGMDLSQVGMYTVQLQPLDDPYMLRAKTATNEVVIALAGLYTHDLGNPQCNAIVKERLDLLTSNPAAVFFIDVIAPDPMHPGAVVARATRHDGIDIGLDLVASGFAILSSSPVPGLEHYLVLRDAARDSLMGMWNEGECQFTPMFLEGQNA